MEEDQKVKNCPYCGASNPLAANFCRKCRFEFSEESKSGKRLNPVIKKFRVIEDKYVVGSTVHLTWEVKNATNIFLDSKDVSLFDECEYTVKKLARLQIKAINNFNEVTGTLSIKPLPLPKFKKFQSNVISLIKGYPVKVSWNVEHSTKLEIVTQKFTKEVKPIDSIMLRLMESQEVTLRAYSYDPTVSEERSIYVEVISEVEIIKVEANTLYGIEGRPVKISWDIKNADHIILLPLHIDVTDQTNFEVFPRIDTVYKLVARNKFSQKEHSISIGVYTLPHIDIKILEKTESFLSNISLPKLRYLDIGRSEGLGKLTKCFLTSKNSFLGKKIFNHSIFKKLNNLTKFKFNLK